MDNPYRSDASTRRMTNEVPASNLERTYGKKRVQLFRTALTLYKRYQDRDMAFFEVVRLYLVNWVVMGIILLLPIGLLAWNFSDGSTFSNPLAFFGGLFLGRVIRDIHHLRVSCQIWPVLRDVIHWDHVDAKLDELGAP